MRMEGLDSEQPSAADLLNHESLDELVRIFTVYGEERYAYPIAKAIVEDRETTPWSDTLLLANLIERVYSDISGVDQHYYARGVLLQRTRNALVCNNRFQSINGCGILAQQAGVPVEEGQCVIEGNVFRVLNSDPKALYAVRVEGLRGVVRNNTSWEPATLIAQGKFSVASNGGAHIHTGVAGNYVTDGNFTDSNLVLSYGVAVAPPGALQDENGVYILDENGNFIVA
jgi:hypothetical protein